MRNIYLQIYEIYKRYVREIKKKTHLTKLISSHKYTVKIYFRNKQKKALRQLWNLN